MFKQYVRNSFIAIVIIMLAASVAAQNVLIWDNDNGSDYSDPENYVTRPCEYGIQRALAANNVSYTTLSTLPSNLDSYDIVFVELGIYCRS